MQIAGPRAGNRGEAPMMDDKQLSEHVESNRLAPWIGHGHDDEATPFDFPRVEIWRNGWKQTQTVEPLQFSSDDVAGLYWRPAQQEDTAQ